jgi:uncharacterized membrane protein
MRCWNGRRGWLRAGLSALFIGSRLAHLIWPDVYLPITPQCVSYPAVLKFMSGVAVIADGVGLHFPPTQRAARCGLSALPCRGLPANG